MPPDVKATVQYGLLIGGFLGLFAGLPLILIVCCTTVLLISIVREAYIPLIFGAGVGISLMVAFGPLVTMFIGIAMLVAGSLMKLADE